MRSRFSFSISMFWCAAFCFMAVDLLTSMRAGRELIVPSHCFELAIGLGGLAACYIACVAQQFMFPQLIPAAATSNAAKLTRAAHQGLLGHISGRPVAGRGNR